jgi:hypothetical protein
VAVTRGGEAVVAGTSRTSGLCTGGVEHAARLPRITATTPRAHTDMLLLALEALGALLIFVFIIWWTMFAGRNKGERKDD